MCIQCYEEHGSPAIINERTIEAARLVGLLYDVNSVGGCAHIVIDDWNLEDGSIDSSLEWCDRPDQYGWTMDPESVTRSRAVLLAFKALTIEERASALALFDGFVLNEPLIRM
jgi:hypothetical protein